MIPKSKVIENLNWSTERMSDRVWSVSVGVLATALAYLVEGSKGEGSTPFLDPASASVAAVLAILALLADLLQYYAASRQNAATLRLMESRGLEEASYDTAAFAYRARSAAFHAKIAFCVGAAAWLVLATSLSVLRTG